jgi:exonuclease SbcC
VKIVCDDGHTIEWRRKNSPSYQIDGQLFDRLRGTGLPDELHQALRLPKVDAGDDSDFDVHFGTQKSPIFLLGSSSTNAARFFASSSDAIRLVQMQKRHKEKAQEAQREKNRLEAEALQVNAELAALEPVVDLDRRVKQLEADHREVLRLREAIEDANASIQSIDLQATVIDRHAAESKVLSELAPAPALEPTEDLDLMLAELPAAKNQLDAWKASTAALTGLAAPPKLDDVAMLYASCQQIASLEESLQVNAARRQSLAGLTPAPRLDETSNLEAQIANLVAARQHVQTSAAQAAALSAITSPPAITDVQPLSRHLQDLLACNGSVDQCQARYRRLSELAAPSLPIDAAPLADCLQKLAAAAAQVKANTSQVAEAESALADAAEALRIEAQGRLCPICSTPLDPDRLLANTVAGMGGHAHG